MEKSMHIFYGDARTGKTHHASKIAFNRDSAQFCYKRKGKHSPYTQNVDMSTELIVVDDVPARRINEVISCFPPKLVIKRRGFLDYTINCPTVIITTDGNALEYLKRTKRMKFFYFSAHRPTPNTI